MGCRGSFKASSYVPTCVLITEPTVSDSSHVVMPVRGESMCAFPATWMELRSCTGIGGESRWASNGSKTFILHSEYLPTGLRGVRDSGESAERDLDGYHLSGILPIDRQVGVTESLGCDIN